MAKPFQADLLRRLYNSYNRAHAPGRPGPHMWLSPGPGPDSKCFKTAEVIHVKSKNPVISITESTAI